MDLNQCVLQELTESAVLEISQWAYKKPYDVHNLKGHSNEYLFNKETWCKEQYYLTDNVKVIWFVTCRYNNGDLWVGWSLKPDYCGKDQGHKFIEKCIVKLGKREVITKVSI